MKKVLDTYARHIARLMQKESTAKRRAGIAYYRAAAETVQALIDAPTPAWVGLKFTHPQRTR
jgi:hypothetical protein